MSLFFRRHTTKNLSWVVRVMLSGGLWGSEQESDEHFVAMSLRTWLDRVRRRIDLPSDRSCRCNPLVDSLQFLALS